MRSVVGSEKDLTEVASVLGTRVGCFWCCYGVRRRSVLIVGIVVVCWNATTFILNHIDTDIGRIRSVTISLGRCQLQLQHTARSLAERRLAGELLVDAVRISSAH